MLCCGRGAARADIRPATVSPSFLHLVAAHACVVAVADPSSDALLALPRLLAGGGWGGGSRAVAVAARGPRAAVAAAHRLAALTPPWAVGRQVGYAVEHEDVCEPVRGGGQGGQG